VGDKVDKKKRKMKLEWRDRWAVIRQGVFTICKVRSVHPHCHSPFYSFRVPASYPCVVSSLFFPHLRDLYLDDNYSSAFDLPTHLSNTYPPNSPLLLPHAVHTRTNVSLRTLTAIRDIDYVNKAMSIPLSTPTSKRVIYTKWAVSLSSSSSAPHPPPSSSYASAK
jgi:hypothetical protein